MPNWNEILDEISICPYNNALDHTRVKYLELLSNKTNRNVIAYYSGWLQVSSGDTGINDNDKNAFMSTIHRLDRTKGLDLILHTPGGNIAATESIVDYLHIMFNNDIRVIVPQIAMSAGTMIACSAKEIIMGENSNLGPIDPQYGGMPTQSVIEEFERAKEEMGESEGSRLAWREIIRQYHPTFILECEKANKWSHAIVSNWLNTCMFSDEPSATKETIISNIVDTLSDHDQNKTHSRHISKQQCKDLGLKIIDLEDDDELQDIVLSIHHAFMHTFSGAPGVVKIVENQTGSRMIFRNPM